MIVSRQNENNDSKSVGSVKDYGAIIVVANTKKVPLYTFNNWTEFNRWIYNNNYTVINEKIYKSIL